MIKLFNDLKNNYLLYLQLTFFLWRSSSSRSESSDKLNELSLKLLFFIIFFSFESSKSSKERDSEIFDGLTDEIL